MLEVYTKNGALKTDTGETDFNESLDAQVPDAGTSEVVVVSKIIPANSATVGTTYRLTAFAVVSTDASGGTSTWRCRIGPTTLTGEIATQSAAGSGANLTNTEFVVVLMVTFRSIGAGIAEVRGAGYRISSGNTFTNIAGADVENTSVTVDSTVDNLIELTYQDADAGSNVRFEIATIERIVH